MSMSVAWAIWSTVVIWCLGALVALLVPAENDNEYLLRAIFWPLALLLAAWRFVVRGARLIAPTEEARLRRRIRAVEKERRLLALRRDLEAKEGAYRAEFDRYISPEDR